MKYLFLLRHAQTLPSEGKPDKERKLTPVGISDAHALGKTIKNNNLQPDFILCSPATRTKETLACVMQSLEGAGTEFPEKMYNGSKSDLLRFIQDTDDAFSNLMVVAHNPGIYELSASLCTENNETLLARLAAGYKPGTLSVFECDCESWADLRPGKNKLVNFWEPLDYNAPSTPARWT